LFQHLSPQKIPTNKIPDVTGSMKSLRRKNENAVGRRGNHVGDKLLSPKGNEWPNTYGYDTNLSTNDQATHGHVHRFNDLHGLRSS
jgi:hypothetical protein